jgi:hypothetical protein
MATLTQISLSAVGTADNEFQWLGILHSNGWIAKKSQCALKTIECVRGVAVPQRFERLWSMAGLIMTDKRYSTTPMNFKADCFLKFNRKWWDMSTIARSVRAVQQVGSTNKRMEEVEEEELETEEFWETVTEY